MQRQFVFGFGSVLAAIISLSMGSQAASQTSSDAALEAACRATEPTAPESCPCTITKARAAGLSAAELASLFKDDGHSSPVEPAKYGRFWEGKAACIAEATMAKMGISPSNPLPGVPVHMRPRPAEPANAAPYVARPNSGTPLPANQYIGTRAPNSAAVAGSLGIGQAATVSIEETTSDIDDRVSVTETYRFANFDYLFGYDTVIRDNADLFAMAQASARKDIPEWRDSFGSGSRIRGEVSHGWSTYGSLGRLLTISVTGYTNDRPQGQFIDALLWDSELDREIAWTDVFDAGLWNGKIRRDYCNALQAERRKRGTQRNTSCPDFDQLLIGFKRSENGQLALSMAALAYIAGSYAEGPYDVSLAIDPVILAGTKTPYRTLLGANQGSTTIALRHRLGKVEYVLVGDIQASDDFYFVSGGAENFTTAEQFEQLFSQARPSHFMTLYDAADGKRGYSIRLDNQQHDMVLVSNSADFKVQEYSDGVVTLRLEKGQAFSNNPAFGYGLDRITITKGSESDTFQAINFGGA